MDYCITSNQQHTHLRCKQTILINLIYQTVWLSGQRDSAVFRMTRVRAPPGATSWDFSVTSEWPKTTHISGSQPFCCCFPLHQLQPPGFPPSCRQGKKQPKHEIYLLNNTNNRINKLQPNTIFTLITQISQSISLDASFLPTNCQ